MGKVLKFDAKIFSASASYQQVIIKQFFCHLLGVEPLTMIAGITIDWCWCVEWKQRDPFSLVQKFDLILKAGTRKED